MGKNILYLLKAQRPKNIGSIWREFPNLEGPWVEGEQEQIIPICPYDIL